MVVVSVLVWPVAFEIPLDPANKQPALLDIRDESICRFNKDGRASAAKWKPELLEFIDLP